MTAKRTEDQQRRDAIGKRWQHALTKIDFDLETRIGALAAIGYDIDSEVTKVMARRQEFAHHLRRPDRTVRRWISGQHETPREIELILDWLIAGKISLDDLR